jgi:hypothetical protein
MISVGSQARFATPFKSFFLTKIAAPIGLAAFLCWAAPGTAMSQPVSPAVSPGPATCRTPAVEARIQELRKEVADREQDDEGAQKVVTSYTLKGASPNPVYKRYYDFLQESLRLRQELAQLEGLPPCPQPVAATPITSAGQYNSPFNDRSGYTGYRPFYYTPGYTPLRQLTIRPATPAIRPTTIRRFTTRRSRRRLRSSAIRRFTTRPSTTPRGRVAGFISARRAAPRS